MDACEQIVRDLLLHEDSWPFTQAVNLREVGFRFLFSSRFISASIPSTDVKVFEFRTLLRLFQTQTIIVEVFQQANTASIYD